MLELELIDALAIELDELFDGYLLPNKAGTLQQVAVFKQFVPTATGLTAGSGAGLNGYTDSDYESNFPCIVVKYVEHTDYEERRLDQSLTNIKLIYGVYDAAVECQGYRDILNMIDMTRLRFLNDRIVAQKFMLDMPVKTRLLEADTWPVYYGEMDLKFITGRPVMGRDHFTRRAVV